ncbi:MAG TPA: translation factor Sua5, partial [Paludibacteraceae bacterium]|nr:translation factor Sua5 [Paludibacteraceae bacterium]
IDEAIKSAVDYVVNWRQDDISEPKPSSIIKLNKGNIIEIIRK